MIFIRFNGKTCIEGVDLRSLDLAVAAIQKTYPGKAVRSITKWAVLQWEPEAGSGRIEIQGGDVIHVAARTPLADERRSQPFFLPAPGIVNLVSDGPGYPPVQIKIDPEGNLIEASAIRPTMPG